MSRFHSILAVTDFSVGATHAVRTAAMLARSHHARLTLLHVVDRSGCPSLRRWFSASSDIALKSAQARAALRQFAAEIAGRHGVTARCRVAIGDPFDTILQASEGADLLVLGHRRGLLPGSTADRLLRHGRKPMLVVRRPVDTPYRRILVAVDFTDHSEVSLHAAACLAPQARFHVLHAVASGREWEMQMADLEPAVIREVVDIETEQARAGVNRLVGRAGLDATRVSTAVLRGSAPRAVLREERAFGADLVVTGKQGRSAMAEFLLGSVTRRLLADARSDMLVVPRAAIVALRAHAATARRPVRASVSAAAAVGHAERTLYFAGGSAEHGERTARD